MKILEATMKEGEILKEDLLSLVSITVLDTIIFAVKSVIKAILVLKSVKEALIYVVML